jgi:hypothetical protein
MIQLTEAMALRAKDPEFKRPSLGNGVVGLTTYSRGIAEYREAQDT